jgi:hypothetical protein
VALYGMFTTCSLHLHERPSRLVRQHRCRVGLCNGTPMNGACNPEARRATATSLWLGNLDFEHIRFGFHNELDAGGLKSREFGVEDGGRMLRT